MINNNATLGKTPTTSRSPRTGHFHVRQAFYDRVRSNFLQQSARYLRSDRGRASRPSGSDGDMLLRS